MDDLNPHWIQSKLLNSALKRAESNAASGYYYPLLFSVGTEISPEDFLKKIKIAKNESTIDEKLLEQLLVTYHELVHAFTFLSTPYAGIVLALMNDASNAIFALGIDPKAPDLSFVRKNVALHIVDDEMTTRFSIGGSRSISDWDLERRRKRAVYLEVQDTIDRETRATVRVSKVCLARLRREVETNMALRIFRLPNNFDISDGLQLIKGHNLRCPNNSIHDDFVQLSLGRYYPCKVFTRDNQKYALLVNPALLSECIAIISEFNLIEFLTGNSISEASIRETIRKLPVEYRACFEIIEDYGISSWAEKRAALIAISEICFSFGGIGNVISEGHRRSVGELFYDCCLSLKKPKVRRKSADAWFKTIARAIGAVSPKQSKRIAYLHIADYLETNFPFEQMNEPMLTIGADSLFSQALSVGIFNARQHYEQKLTMQMIIDPSSLHENLLIGQNSISFFNPKNRERWPLFLVHPENGELKFEYFESYSKMTNKNSFGGVLLAYIAYKYARRENVDCPLKMGIPFRCTEAILGQSEYCDLSKKPQALGDEQSYSFGFYCPYANWRSEYFERIRKLYRFIDFYK